MKAEAAVALALLGEKDVLPEVRRAAAARDPELASLAWKALAIHADAGAKADAAKLLGEPMPGTRDPRRGGALHVRVWAALLICRVK